MKKSEIYLVYTTQGRALNSKTFESELQTLVDRVKRLKYQLFVTPVYDIDKFLVIEIPKIYELDR